MKQDSHQAAKERYEDARDAAREMYAQMREDLRFSNPSNPQQWGDDAINARKGRPCLTFDRTNQFIAQVVNDARQNKPSITVLPADSEGSEETAKRLNGIIRQIEYTSRAAIAYDTAIEHAARNGLGWLRVVPEVSDPETNEQDIRIKRIHDPLSAVLDPSSVEPDGSDAMYGFVETRISKAAFKRAYPKASTDGWQIDGVWCGERDVLICEELLIETTPETRLIVQGPEGQSMSLTRDEFEALSAQVGFTPPVSREVKTEKRKVMWRKLNGHEVLEETEFPSIYLPLVPVLGHELWIDGKRYLCGMARRMMDSQRAYNYERSAFVESVAMQPKAPLMVPVAAQEGLEEHWARLNSGNPASLPWNHVDGDGNPIPSPSRLAPPAFPAAFAQGGQIASTDMEAAVGMYKANLGQQGNETSGRAIRAREQQGDTATFHYVDNLSRSMAQLGRVVVDMIPRIMDTARTVRTIDEDGTHGFVKVDPEMQQSALADGKRVEAINPNVGKYDVRVTVGPSYGSVREEAAQNIIDIAQGNPALGAALAPMLMKMKGMPEAEKMQKIALAMLPPPVQQAYNDDEGPAVPPQVEAAMQGMQQRIQELEQALQQAGSELEDKRIDREKQEADALIRAFDAVTKRISATTVAMTPEQVAAIAQQTVMQALQQPSPMEEPGEQMAPELMEMPQEVPPDPSEPMNPAEPPAGGFFSSEGAQ